ncbi:MAG: hypothetical protein AUJ52_11165 [Elusimicrobia bacterium CG1_02_63_36]|nr:MAG: hypothetical protein AUJ52_11165 [Elusimicrobia bacterium CG1_02_63_36]PIP83244.1 MAG: hypothetical protein COR54_10580 [Elusimicrobia bacterium CG22_combo_CG10-13_8_21_14_all_63_91]PJA14142.1 MAG: hypothetical protein COX66_13070 [Elusimicrobia bacterium CG_4_10_14_0_2_um_filter_63_34]PJB24753.1 MAG: hypothetical protein CO113_12230 [Elusimicrobia bacterium CG_4_9_14_3_um_filter_62_55]
MSKSKKSGTKSTKAAEPAAKPKATTATASPGPKPIIRAIRVTAEVLAAAKVYRKEKGVSFYQLGLNAISEVLRREGYLKVVESKA